MEELTIKQFNVLLSTPSDVEKYSKQVVSAIAKFNNELANDYGVFFRHKSWKDSVYPDYGTEPQSIINKQIVNDSDMVIALFGARLGTPTKSHESGTVEEIVKIHDAGGKVLTYFATGKLVPINSIEPEQLTKLKEFKKTYLGIYNEFETSNGLKTKVFESLKNIAKELKAIPSAKLILKTKFRDNIIDELHYVKYRFLDHDYVEKQYGIITQLIKQIDGIVLKKAFVKCEISEKIANKSYNELTPQEKEKIHKKFSMLTTLGGKAVEFSSQFKNVIKRFCDDHRFSVGDDFFDVGNATETNILYSYSLSGTDMEKEKVQKIRDLYWAIIKYNGSTNFLRNFDNKYFLILVLQNAGNSFCEDIDLVVKFAENDYCSLDKIEFYDVDSAKELQDFVDEVLIPSGDTEIEDMNTGSIPLPVFIPRVDVILGQTEPELSYYNQVLETKIKNIYPYIKSTKNGQITLKINVGNLKQFSSTYVCGKLVFNKEVTQLDYVITTKSLNRQEKGTLLRTGIKVRTANAN